MNDVFATTHNVRRFMTGVEILKKPVKGRIGIMVAYGPYGSGKTEIGEWFNSKHNVPYVRAMDGGTRRTLLANIVTALEVVPKYRAADIFDQALNLLDETSKPLIIDEADYLVDSGIIETIRDLNDMTNAPIILIGMETFDRKIKAYPHLVDRVTVTVKFELFDTKGLANYAEQICDVALSGSAYEFIHVHGKGRLRMTTTWLERCERIARLNKLDVVEGKHLEAYLVKNNDSH